jgi:hypothetical protein
MHKIFKKLVMAFTAKNVISDKKVEEPSNAPLPNLQLTKGEVETLLMMVKEAHFKGEHVQTVYELVIKLQNYYTELT